MTPREAVLHVLEENFEGLEFNVLMRRCNYIGHKDAFQGLLRNLVKAGKVFAWNGKFHHGKYRGEEVRAKKKAATEKAKRTKNQLRKVVKKVNNNLDAKIVILDKLIDVVSEEKAVVLKLIKSDLKFVSDAGL